MFARASDSAGQRKCFLISLSASPISLELSASTTKSWMPLVLRNGGQTTSVLGPAGTAKAKPGPTLSSATRSIAKIRIRGTDKWWPLPPKIETRFAGHMLPRSLVEAAQKVSSGFDLNITRIILELTSATRTGTSFAWPVFNLRSSSACCLRLLNSNCRKNCKKLLIL